MNNNLIYELFINLIKNLSLFFSFCFISIDNKNKNKNKI